MKQIEKAFRFILKRFLPWAHFPEPFFFYNARIAKKEF